MKIKKSLLSVCLSISLMFGCLAPSISAYAVGDSWSSAQSYTYFQNNFDDINSRLNGVIINQNGLREDFEDFVDEYRNNYNIPSGTSSSTWIGDNISGTYQNGSSGVADLGFSQTFRQAMRDWCNAYLEANTGFKYGYTWPSAMFSNYTYFDSEDKFHGFLDICNDNVDKYIFLYGSQIYVSDVELTPVIQSFYSSLNSYVVRLYYEWEESFGEYDIYTWSTSANSWVATHYTSGSPKSETFISASVPQSSGAIQYGVPVSLNTKTYLCYKSDSAMRNGTEGIQDYYTTDSYNSTISGSYNTTTSDIQNTIDSNNINNYINNYYVQNGEYPTPTQINIYINNYTGDNGGGGSDPDDPSDPDSPNWDFGFLSTIGQFLAELIAGIGEVIGGILSGLTSIISSLREGIPNVIGSLLEYFLPFLPEEVITMISLSIVFAILVGIIKLFRS